MLTAASGEDAADHLDAALRLQKRQLDSNFVDDPNIDTWLSRMLAVRAESVTNPADQLLFHQADAAFTQTQTVPRDNITMEHYNAIAQVLPTQLSHSFMAMLEAEHLTASDLSSQPACLDYLQFRFRPNGLAWTKVVNFFGILKPLIPQPPLQQGYGNPLSLVCSSNSPCMGLTYLLTPTGTLTALQPSNTLSPPHSSHLEFWVGFSRLLTKTGHCRSCTRATVNQLDLNVELCDGTVITVLKYLKYQELCCKLIAQESQSRAAYWLLYQMIILASKAQVRMCNVTCFVTSTLFKLIK